MKMQLRGQHMRSGRRSWRSRLRDRARTNARARAKARARDNWTGPFCNQTSGNATGWSIM